MMKNREEKTTCKNESSKQQLGIVLNRMYAGQYLEHNLGHFTDSQCLHDG